MLNYSQYKAIIGGLTMITMQALPSMTDAYANFMDGSADAIFFVESYFEGPLAEGYMGTKVFYKRVDITYTGPLSSQDSSPEFLAKFKAGAKKYVARYSAKLLEELRAL